MKGRKIKWKKKKQKEKKTDWGKDQKASKNNKRESNLCQNEDDEDINADVHSQSVGQGKVVVKCHPQNIYGAMRRAI